MANGIMIGNIKIKVEYNVFTDKFSFRFIPTESFEFDGDSGRAVYYMLWRMEDIQEELPKLYKRIGWLEDDK